MSKGSLEIRIFNFIKDLYQEMVDMRPEDGFSSPRDIELVKELNKKKAVFDKLQEAMKVYNPYFEYEPELETKKDLSINPRFGSSWKEKQMDYSNYDPTVEYVNVWSETIKLCDDVKDLLKAYQFNYKDGVDTDLLQPTIMKGLIETKVDIRQLYLFTLIEKECMCGSSYSTITYEEVKSLFKYHGNLDIEPIRQYLINYGLMILTKSRIPEKVKFIFRITDIETEEHK